jgi:hypothetical protein
VCAQVEHFYSWLYYTIYLVTRLLVGAALESRAPATPMSLSYLSRTACWGGKLLDTASMSCPGGRHFLFGMQ